MTKQQAEKLEAAKAAALDLASVPVSPGVLSDALLKVCAAVESIAPTAKK